MEMIMSLLVGIFFAVAIYLMLSKHSIRMLLGVAVLGNAVNLLLFVSGRITRDIPPIMEGEATVLSASAANPLPQALILTAIVISFSFFAFLLVLTYRAFQDLKTDNTDHMRSAEPEGQAMPPVTW
jgi:multicomponent Na+:H+ antiporter subunit C